MKNQNKSLALLTPQFAVATTLEPSKAEQLKPGVRFAETAKGQLDCACLVGGTVKRLMPLKSWLKLNDLSAKKDAAKVKAECQRYNKEIKPRFWAWFNEALTVAKAHSKPNAVGFRQRVNGDVVTTFKYLAEAPKDKPDGKIATGEAKRIMQSKQRAERKPLTSVGRALEKAAAPSVDVNAQPPAIA